MLILPAIDLRDGKCVRLIQGDYNRETIYGEDPGQMAASFAEQGAQYIHVVDLDGAKAGKPQNLHAIESIVKASGVPVEAGGGIRSLETARQLLDLGVSRVIFGTRLLSMGDDARAYFETLGEQAVAGIDSRDGRVAVTGWTEGSGVDALGFAEQLEEKGARRFIVTDIATDGMLRGPNLPMLESFATTLSGAVIASGGVSSLDDLKAIESVAGGKIEGAIVGKAIYEGRFTVAQAVGRP